MSRSRALLVTAVALATAATPAFAATSAKKLPTAKPLVISDPAGDANGINSQGGLVPVPSQSGQGERSAADLLGLSVGRLDDGKQVTGLAVTFTLGAKPDQGTIYRVQMSTPDCKTLWMSYNVPIGGPISTTMTDDCDTAGTTVVTKLPDATVKDATITIAAPFSILNKKIKLGTLISGSYGETKGHVYTGVRNPTVPTIDETTVATATYKIGD